MISKVREIAKEIMSVSKHVEIDETSIKALSHDIKESPKSSWKMSSPAWSVEPMTDNHLVQYEVIASSINYCYWYGSGSIRPSGVNSTRMYQLLDETITPGLGVFINEKFLNRFYSKLVEERFPLLEERYRHLQEILKARKHMKQIEDAVLKDKDVDKTVSLLAKYYPGFGSDMFLKRAQLFVMQMQRHLNIFDEEQIKQLTVPADYQIPKILSHLGCIWYDHILRLDIGDKKLIPRGSLREIKIRAATILACDMLAEQSGTNTMIVDNFLWQSRKESDVPFHLTVTTDY